jgi:hypothetical protein
MVGSIAYAPIALIFPACLWLFDHRDWWKRSFKHQVAYALHWLLLLIGVLVTVGGTYAVIKQIADAYATGVIGQSIFSFGLIILPSLSVSLVLTPCARTCRFGILVRRQLQLHLAGCEYKYFSRLGRLRWVWIRRSAWLKKWSAHMMNQWTAPPNSDSSSLCSWFF